MKTLQQQYSLVKGSRGVLFNYLADIPFEKLQIGLETVDNRSICYLLNHTGNSYLSWLSEFVFNTPLVVRNETAWTSIDDVRVLYKEVDDAVFNFLDAFEEETTEITRLKARQNVIMTLSVLQLFTHVITHEFHHKGMILNMTRQLGFTPVDTDIIRF